MSQSSIDREQVLLPVINFTESANSQLKLIMENDFTLSGKYFRLLISGKGCEGFTYSSGFSDIEKDDFIVEVKMSDEDIQILIDPFAAFYLQNATVDYVQDFENDQEGFVITNHSQKKYAGKFWRKNEEKVPPQKETIEG
jgi:iron-sulfur cluster assembly accessory protein